MYKLLNLGNNVNETSKPTRYPWDSILVRSGRKFPCDWCLIGQWWRHRSRSQTTPLASLAGTHTMSQLQTESSRKMHTNSRAGFTITGLIDSNIWTCFYSNGSDNLHRRCRTDQSIIFTRWRNPISSFSSRKTASPQNGTSIGSAVFAGFTVTTTTPNFSPPGCATSRLRPVNRFCG